MTIALAVAAFALAGCGSTASTGQGANRMEIDATLTAINANIKIALTSNPGSLLLLTNDYIAEVQQSESVLGADLAKQKLADVASEVAPYCDACVQSLNAAAAQIGS
jgi:hypothetical protein